MNAMLAPLHPHSVDRSTGVVTPKLPKFELSLQSIVVVDGRECKVVRRVSGDRWELVDMADGCLSFPTDEEIASKMRDGNWYFDGESGIRIYAPPPPSPIAIGPKAHASNLRKHAYVEACLATPEGLRCSRTFINPIAARVAAEREEDPPAFTTILNWIGEYRRFGEAYGTAAYSDRHDRKGRPAKAPFEHLSEPIQEALDAWLVVGKKALAYALLVKRVRELDEDRGHLIAPTLDPDYLDQLTPSRRISPGRRSLCRTVLMRKSTSTTRPSTSCWSMRAAFPSAAPT